MNLSVIVSVESFELFTVSWWTPHVTCTSWKNYQTETDALKKNVVQYSGEAGLSQHPSWMKCLTNYHINKCSIHKMVSFRNKCDLFATEARIYLKGVLITLHVCEKRCKPLFPKDVYWNSLFFFLALRAPSWALASLPNVFEKNENKNKKKTSVCRLRQPLFNVHLVPCSCSLFYDQLSVLPGLNDCRKLNNFKKKTK